MPERCQSSRCGAEVVFVRSAKTGKMQILDAKPRKGIILVGFDRGVRTWSQVEGDPDRMRAHVVDVYTDHHATCPDAPSWKGRARKNPPLSVVPEPPEENGADPAMAEAGDLVVGLPSDTWVSLHCRVGRHAVCQWNYGGPPCACDCGHPLVPEAPKGPGVRA